MTCAGTLKVTTPTDTEIVITRLFDAPRALVWDAMTNPDRLMRWCSGPPGWSMVACDNDLRVGGGFRCVWRGPGNTEMMMRGIYREVVPPERIVRTESFESGCNAQSAGAGEQVGTLVLTEHGGGGDGGTTTLMLTLLYASKQARDAAVASGMERNVAAGYDRLEAVLAAMPALRGSRPAA